MRISEEINIAMAETGASVWGSAAFDSLRPHMDARQLAKTEKICKSAAGVVVAAFPYYAGRHDGNISLYARGGDYHTILTGRLEKACRVLTGFYPEKRFVPLVDASPLPEKAAAQKAGIGLTGQNTLIYCGEYGSFVFLGCILTDLPLKDTGENSKSCVCCGKCVEACPGGALKVINGQAVFEPRLCLSSVTQKKGNLSPEERQAIRSGRSAWGCDVCQLVCPMNAKVKITKIRAFSGGDGIPLLNALKAGELGESEEGFEQLYGSRSFAWKGRDVLMRNLSIISGNDSED